MESPGRITLWGIEVFLATADERSVSAAARRLGASPSAVSQQLTNLEAAIGATLLERRTRPIRLTPAGEILRRRAQTIVNEAALARAELAMSDLSALTRFRLGMIEDFEADVTPRLLAHMGRELENCQFLLETGASHALFDLLEARQLDVIVAADFGAEADWIEVHPLLREGLVIAAAKGAIDPGKDVKQQLQARPFVQYTQRHYMGRLILSHLAGQRFHVPHRFELDSYHAILALVGQGAGWTILPPLALMRASRFADQIDVLPLPFEPLSRIISVTARKGVLQDIPARLSQSLKPILETRIIRPARDRYRFLSDTLTLL